MKLSRIAVGGATGIMGLGLLGVGAHATFTTNTTGKQSVSAGYLSVVLSATGASGNGTKAISLAASPNNGSTFTTGTTKVSYVNNGTVPATAITSTPGETYTASNAADTAMAHEVYLCIVSTTQVSYNGKLATAPAQEIAGTLKPTQGTSYIMNVYAGKVHTACGTATTYTYVTPAGGTSTSPSLTTTAQGGSVTVSETLTFQG